MDFFLVSKSTSEEFRGPPKNLRPPFWLGRFSFRGRGACTYSESIEPPYISLDRLASSLDMIILLEVMVYKRGHILGIKKGLLLFPSATLKTHL